MRFQKTVNHPGDVFHAGVQLAELGQFQIEEFMVESLDDGLRHDSLELRNIDQQAVAIECAGEGDLQFVVVPVPERVVAFAERLAILSIAQCGIVLPMGGGEFKLLAESNHGMLFRKTTDG